MKTAIAFVVLFVLSIVASVYVHNFASCDKLGYLPVKDLPARCLMVKP